jgi:hypothetical protein
MNFQRPDRTHTTRQPGGQEREAVWQQERTLCRPAFLIYTLTEEGAHVGFERTGTHSDLFC